MKLLQRNAASGAPRNQRWHLAWILLVLAFAAPSVAEHLAREDPPEPIFTQRAFIENDLETGIDWGRGFGTQDLEIGLGTTWVFFDRLQLGAEIPLGISIPDDGSTHADLADINLSAKWLLCCEEPTGYTFAAARFPRAHYYSREPMQRR